MDGTFQASEPINRSSTGLYHWSNALDVATATESTNILRIGLLHEVMLQISVISHPSNLWNRDKQRQKILSMKTERILRSLAIIIHLRQRL